jgi:predicted Zn-dependent protease
VTTPQQLAERVVELGADCDGCVAIADETTAVHVRWAGAALTTNGSARSRRLTVICIAGSSAGAASRSGVLDDASLKDLVTGAKRAARADSGEESRPLLAGPAGADWEAPPAETDVGSLADFAAGLSATINHGGPDRPLVSGYAEQQVNTVYLALSTGLLLRHVQPTAVVDLVAARSDGSAWAWAGAGSASLRDVDCASLGAQLDAQLGWATRTAKLRPGTYEVLLTPACVADLMLHVYGAAGATEAIRGQSVFSRPCGGTRLGERLTAAQLTLRSDPREPGLECAPFTIARKSDDRTSVLDNGLRLTPARWITDGVLTALVQTRQTAQLTAQPSTGGIDNLVLEGPDNGATLAEMVAQTKRALLVTSLWYLRDVDPGSLLLTGLTRDGVYLVEHGEVRAALPDFRFNESPIELLGRVVEVGRTERTLPREWGDYFTRVAMPPLRVEQFDVSAVCA